MKTLSAELRSALEAADHMCFSGDARPHRLILNGQLSVKVYADFKRILESLGGRWERGDNQHSFVTDPSDDIKTILSSGLLPALNPYDYFPTPADIVDFIIGTDFVDGILEMMRWKLEQGKRCRALEPSAGSGAFASAMAEKLGGADNVVTLELNPVNCRNLRHQGFSPVEIDFLKWETDERFDLIILNPPFAGRLWKKHLDHAMKFLSPSGRLVCIAPITALDVRSQDDKEWLRSMLNRSDIEHNAKHSFADAGTKIDTLIFFVDQPPRRSPRDGWAHEDIALFHMLVNNDTSLHRKYRTFFDGESGLFCRLGNGIRTVTGCTLSREHKKAFFELCHSLNDDLLTDRNTPTGLVLLNEDFIECLDYEFSEYRLQQSIAETPTDLDTGVTNEGAREIPPSRVTQLALF